MPLFQKFCTPPRFNTPLRPSWIEVLSSGNQVLGRRLHGRSCMLTLGCMGKKLRVTPSQVPITNSRFWVAVFAPHKEEIAEKMFLSLPVSVHTLVGSNHWKGGALMKLKSEVQRPSSSECAVNAPWMEPVLHFYPSKAWLEHRWSKTCFPCISFFMANVF